MCFSPEADFASAAVLAPVGVLALRAAARHVGPRALPLAALPALLAVHQALSGVVWLGLDSDVGEGTLRAAAIAYLLIAQALLPAFVPLAFLVLERRRAVAPLLAVGVVVGAYLAMTILSRPVDVLAGDRAVVYVTRTSNDWLIALAYIGATCGPALVSRRPLLRAFGAVNLVGVGLAALVRYEAVTSVWCTYAALASVLVWLAVRGSATGPWTPPASPSSLTRRPATSTGSPTR